MLLSGIGEFVRWADLKDRSVFSRLPPVPRTRARGEEEFWRAFHADRPGILGGVLDAIELRRLAPQLRMHGLSSSFKRRNEGRIINYARF
jgi:hypothetical protein